jgi:hypothetical protein
MVPIRITQATLRKAFSYGNACHPGLSVHASPAPRIESTEDSPLLPLRDRRQRAASSPAQIIIIILLTVGISLLVVELYSRNLTPSHPSVIPPPPPSAPLPLPAPPPPPPPIPPPTDEERWRLMNLRWDQPTTEWLCLEYGTRTYSARLMGKITPGFDRLKACDLTPVIIHNVTIPHPNWCDDRASTISC